MIVRLWRAGKSRQHRAGWSPQGDSGNRKFRPEDDQPLAGEQQRLMPGHAGVKRAILPAAILEMAGLLGQ